MTDTNSERDPGRLDTTVDPDELGGLDRPITGEPTALPAEVPQEGRTDVSGRGTGDIVHEQDLRTP